MDIKDLSKRQREIFDYISRYLNRHGYPPTVREIGKAVGLTSSSTVHAHLSKLESLGILKRDPTKPRAMEVLVQKAKRAVKPTGIPLVGQVAAGSPIVAEENVEEYLQVPETIGGEDGRGFRVTTVGLAAEDARRGDLVRVLNPTSKREVIGRVEAGGLVRVTP